MYSEDGELPRRDARKIQEELNTTPKSSKRISQIRRRTGKNKPKCVHEYGPWGLAEGWTHRFIRKCYGCKKIEESGFFWSHEKTKFDDFTCLEHDFSHVEDIDRLGKRYTCVFCREWKREKGD